MVKIYDELNPAFHPQSIAFIGVSDDLMSFWTRAYWQAMRGFKYQGKMYPVNSRGGVIDGHKIYRTLDEISDSIDYAIVTVSAKVTPSVIRDCARKGIKVVHVLTAGFDEIEDENVSGLQDELTSIAQKAGVRIIGPNCMGIYCPGSNITFSTEFPAESGTVGLISQSGGNSVLITNDAGWRGIRFSKVISYGNACDLNECDYLEYLLHDPETKIIALYIEGVKDGKRVFKLLKEAGNKKPVVLLKGGYGEAGARATSTHTSMLAGKMKSWETLCKQCNVIMADNRDQMIDIIVTLNYIPDICGKNLVVIGPGGGAIVLLTDEFEKRGFTIPALPDAMRK